MGWCFEVRGSNTEPKGPAKIAGKSTNSATTPANKMTSISQPNRCVGVKVLKANTDNPKPLINAA